MDRDDSLATMRAALTPREGEPGCTGSLLAAHHNLLLLRQHYLSEVPEGPIRRRVDDLTYAAGKDLERALVECGIYRALYPSAGDHVREERRLRALGGSARLADGRPWPIDGTTPPRATTGPMNRRDAEKQIVAWLRDRYPNLREAPLEVFAIIPSARGVSVHVINRDYNLGDGWVAIPLPGAERDMLMQAWYQET